MPGYAAEVLGRVSLANFNSLILEQVVGQVRLPSDGTHYHVELALPKSFVFR